MVNGPYDLRDRVVQRNFILPEQGRAVSAPASSVGAAGGRVAHQAIVHEGQGAVGRGTGAEVLLLEVSANPPSLIW